MCSKAQSRGDVYKRQHGNTLENLVLNPTLSDLVGGIQAVTLGDEEARKRGTQKTVLERKAPPTFDVVIEILDRDGYAIHHDVAKTVDLLLRGIPPRPEVRRRSVDGEIRVIEKEKFNDQYSPDIAGFAPREPAWEGANPRRASDMERYPKVTQQADVSSAAPDGHRLAGGDGDSDTCLLYTSNAVQLRTTRVKRPSKKNIITVKYMNSCLLYTSRCV